jgi:hypothetical protein
LLPGGTENPTRSSPGRLAPPRITESALSSLRPMRAKFDHTDEASLTIGKMFEVWRFST